MQVGRTPLFKSKELCGRYGAMVFVKDESKNPFGTFKDRRCTALIERYRNEPETLFVQITTGNSGYSLGMLAAEEERQTGKKTSVVNIVPEGISRVIKARLQTCSIVHEMNLTERVIPVDELGAIARRLANYNGSEGHIHTVEDFGFVDGYGKLIEEIAEAGIRPRYIFCPVGEGELVAELTRSASEVWPEQTPVIIGATIQKNAIVQDVDFLTKPGTSIADKLINNYSKFKALVLRYVRSGKIKLRIVSETQITMEYRYLNSIGIACEPSAAAAFVAARDSEPVSLDDTIVIVNTGKGIYDQRRLDKFWLTRFVKGLKHAAVALAAAAITAGIISGFVIQQNKIEQLFRRQMETQALLYADKDRSYWIDESEAIRMCHTIPRKKCEHGPHVLVNSILDFTDNELMFYVKYKEYEASNDIIGRIMMNDLKRAYMEHRVYVHNGEIHILKETLQSEKLWIEKGHFIK